MLPSPDFESGASAIPPLRHIGNYFIIRNHVSSMKKWEISGIAGQWDSGTVRQGELGIGISTAACDELKALFSQEEDG